MRAAGLAQHSGELLLRRLLDEFSDLPLVAEDLGVITEDVLALKNGFGLPGMRVLAVCLDGDPANAHLPYLHERDCVAYTGTHDNDTTLGWYSSLDRETAQRVDFYLRVTPGAMPEALYAQPWARWRDSRSFRRRTSSLWARWRV